MAFTPRGGARGGFRGGDRGGRGYFILLRNVHLANHSLGVVEEGLEEELDVVDSVVAEEVEVVER